MHFLCPSILKGLPQLPLTSPKKRVEEKHVCRQNTNFEEVWVFGEYILANASKLRFTSSENAPKQSFLTGNILLGNKFGLSANAFGLVCHKCILCLQVYVEGFHHCIEGIQRNVLTKRMF